MCSAHTCPVQWRTRVCTIQVSFEEFLPDFITIYSKYISNREVGIAIIYFEAIGYIDNFKIQFLATCIKQYFIKLRFSFFMLAPGGYEGNHFPHGLCRLFIGMLCKGSFGEKEGVNLGLEDTQIVGERKQRRR